MTEPLAPEPQPTPPSPRTSKSTTTPSCLACVETELSDLLWDVQPARSPTAALTRIKQMVLAAYRAGIRRGKETRTADPRPPRIPPPRA